MNLKYSWIAILGCALGVTVMVAPGQDGDQEWKLKRADSSDKVHFTVKRSRWRNNWSWSSDVPLSRFRGLPSIAMDRWGSVKFEYVHDAGRLVCEGSFLLGRGSGQFTFVPNPDFARDLARLGYEAPAEEDLMSMVMADVSLEFAQGVRDAGVASTTKQLIELRIHGVKLDYIREARRLGYLDLTARDYIEMKIHGVSTEFISDLKRAGYDLPSKQIVELKIHGVSSEYLRDLKTYGLQPSAKDLVELKIHGVSPEYLKDLKDAGYASLTSREVTELKIHGVPATFIHESKRMGYNFTLRELVELKIHGVSSAYLQKLQDSGMKNLNASQITKLKIHGVD